MLERGRVWCRVCLCLPGSAACPRLSRRVAAASGRFLVGLIDDTKDALLDRRRMGFRLSLAGFSPRASAPLELAVALALSGLMSAAAADMSQQAFTVRRGRAGRAIRSYRFSSSTSSHRIGKSRARCSRVLGAAPPRCKIAHTIIVRRARSCRRGWEGLERRAELHHVEAPLAQP